MEHKTECSLLIENLSVTFPGLAAPVLDIPHLTIDGGECVALVGPSGSGKTTLINALTGLAQPTTGEVFWGGDGNLFRLSEAARDLWRARNVGFVMQEFHLFPGLSALDNVLLPIGLRHLRIKPQLLERACTLLNRVGLHNPDQDVALMSRGEMQRVAIARAVLTQPGILIADEPTASLDAENGSVVSDLLFELAHEEGATLIIATHDTRLFERMPRCLRLVSGRVTNLEEA